mmetsp:Transcript_375/g.794  ORF Transcript_375/g.794 Transcript_375/m.794 type:complete len:109 (-) Transcript_375:272-598(-)
MVGSVASCVLMWLAAGRLDGSTNAFVVVVLVEDFFSASTSFSLSRVLNNGFVSEDAMRVLSGEIDVGLWKAVETPLFPNSRLSDNAKSIICRCRLLLQLMQLDNESIM